MKKLITFFKGLDEDIQFYFGLTAVILFATIVFAGPALLLRLF